MPHHLLHSPRKTLRVTHHSESEIEHLNLLFKKLGYCDNNFFSLRAISGEPPCFSSGRLQPFHVVRGPPFCVSPPPPFAEYPSRVSRPETGCGGWVLQGGGGCYGDLVALAGALASRVRSGAWTPSSPRLFALDPRW
ncbi:hypothetical protein Bca101_097947 [Brassica carinata]